MIAVLGAGPHGRQIAHDIDAGVLFDDLLPGFSACRYGAQRHPWVVGAVWPHVRREIAENVSGAGFGPWRNGVVTFPTSYVGIDVQFGNHVHLLPHSTVSHGCVLGDFVTIASGAILCGEVTVEDDVFIGAGAVILHGGITIGQGATIGAGAVVTHNIPARMKVAGVPARCL